MLNPPTNVWMGNIFYWKFLGDASMAARKELASTKWTINLHLQHLEQQDFAIFPFNNAIFDLSLGHIIHSLYTEKGNLFNKFITTIRLIIFSTFTVFLNEFCCSVSFCSFQLSRNFDVVTCLSF